MKAHLKCLLYISAIAAGILIGTNSAQAEERLIFLGEENVFPYSFTENGEQKGIDYDIITEAGKRLQIKIDIHLVPWKRIMDSIQRGTCDAGFTMFYKKDREKFAIYTRTPLHYSTYSVFVRRGSEFKFNSIEDLYGKTAGNVTGYKISDVFDKAASNGKITVEEVPTLEQNARKLAIGRIDCVLGHHDLMLYTLKQLGLSQKIVPLPNPLGVKKPLYAVFSRNGKNIANKESFVETFNTVLENMRNDGTFQKIYDRYLR